VENLRQVLSELPSKEEKAEAISNIDALILFFQDLRQMFAKMPTSTDTESVSSTVSKLDQTLETIESRPELAYLLGIERKSKKPSTLKTNTTISPDSIKGEISELETLPIDTIVERLNRAEYSMAHLGLIGRGLGIRTTKGTPRDALIHQISMKIANYRGYEQLREGAWR
jgi:hypothetical protein